MPWWTPLVLDLLVALILIQAAKSRKEKCSWDLKMANRRFWWGIIGIIAVQAGGFLIMTQGGPGVGIRGLIQWPCIYWVALAIYRKRDLRQQAAAPQN